MSRNSPCTSLDERGGGRVGEGRRRWNTLKFINKLHFSSIFLFLAGMQRRGPILANPEDATNDK